MKGKMKAIVYHGQNDLRLEELDIPEIGPKDVLLKTKYASICGSDLHAVRRGPKWAKAEKQIFGHEFAAEIAEVGSEITRYKVGDRVFGVNMAFCGECWYCRHQDYAHCTGVGDHYTGQGIPGACAQYFKFTDPESEYAFAPYLNSLMPIPDEMTDEQCAMMEPFGVGLGAVNKAGVKEGDTVVILGTGIIGISSLQWCKARGARVIVVGRGRHRLDIAKKCGADHVVSTLDGDCYEQVAALTEETGWYWGKETTTVDAVIDCAGYPGSLNDALKIVKPGGAVCLAALYEDPSPVNPQYIVNKEPKILGTCDNDLLGAMKGILAGTVSVEPLLDGIAGIEDFQEAFDRQMNGTAEKILIDMTR